MEQKMRNSNIELLRIIAMVSIIVCHYFHCSFGGLEFYNLNAYIIQIFRMGGVLGVHLFFIISGYYMYKSKITVRKILKLEGQVLFYSIGLAVIGVFILHNSEITNYKQIIRYIFPTSQNTYWFFTSYILLMIFSKYINKLIDSMDGKTLKNLLLILLIVDFALPTYLKLPIEGIFLDKVCVLYMIGAYIRKYNVAKRRNRQEYKKKMWIYFAIQTMITITVIYIYHFTRKHVMEDKFCFIQHTNPIIALIAIYMFLLFITMKPRNSKIINSISSTTFGIYLIHEHPIIRVFICMNIVNGTQYWNSMFIIIHCIIATVGIFTICSIIDYIRIYTVEKIYMKGVDKIIEKVKKNNKLKITDGV